MRRTQFFVTGFGPFLPDALHNPTLALVERLLLEKVQGASDPGAGGNDCAYDLVDCRVVDVETEAAVAAVDALAACMEGACSGDGMTCRVLIHLGVHSTLKSFHLERCAYNEADFRIPDGAGRQCKKETIREEDGGLKQCVTTLLPLSTIAARMEELGHPCSLSDDAGRYLCNYLYYHSLKLSASVNGEGNGTGKTTSLFVHVPPFTTIAQPAQETFLADLFRTIATHNAAGGVAQ